MAPFIIRTLYKCPVGLNKPFIFRGAGEMTEHSIDELAVQFRGFSPGLAGKRRDPEGSLLRLIALLYITLHQFEVLYLLEKLISPFVQ